MGAAEGLVKIREEAPSERHKRMKKRQARKAPGETEAPNSEPSRDSTRPRGKFESYVAKLESGATARLDRAGHRAGQKVRQVGEKHGNRAAKATAAARTMVSNVKSA